MLAKAEAFTGAGGTRVETHAGGARRQVRNPSGEVESFDLTGRRASS